MTDVAVHIPEPQQRRRIITASWSRNLDWHVNVVYTAFVIAHLWLNLHFYGALNYLWFCDIAMLACCAGFWFNNRLILSMAILSLLGLSLVWTLDLASRVLLGHYWVGVAGYMSARSLPVAIRLVSTFHLWLPILILWRLHSLGYDRRALLWQTLFAIGLLVVSRCVSPPPPAEHPWSVVNINFVYGQDDNAPDVNTPPWLHVTEMVICYWVLMYLPTHLMLRRAFTAPADAVK